MVPQPVIVSPRDLQHVVVKEKDIDKHILMVHKSKSQLEGTNVLKYIEHGETVPIQIRLGSKKGETVKGYHNLLTLQSRKNWYDIGHREPAPILSPYMVRERCFFTWNQANAYALNVFHEIHPFSSEDSLILLGILNSSLTTFFVELQGRLYGKGLLKLETYEIQGLPLINPLSINKKIRKQIENTFLKLCDMQRKGDEKGEEEAKKELDGAVFGALGLTEDERKQVYEGLEALRRMRLQRKEVEVLVETAEKWMPPKKPERKRKIVEEEPTKRLDTWIK